jgi:hypothetical protein
MGADITRCLARSVAALGLVFGLVGAGSAPAASAPPWMNAAASAPLPPHDDKTSAVLMYSETVLAVSARGKIRRLDRRAYRILRPEGEKFGLVRVSFDNDTPVTGLRGWSIPAGGKAFEVGDREAVEAGLEGVETGTFLTDTRSMLLSVPAAVPGSVVGFEFEQELHPYELNDEWDFQQSVPVGESRYTVQLPAGWSYRASWANHEAVMPAGDDRGVWHWTIAPVPAVHLERAMPPWRGVAGRMVVSLIPPAGIAPGWTSWSDLGTWYLGLTRDRTQSSPEIVDKVASLAGRDAPPLDAIRALARFVQNDIRYLAIELGIGGYQPHAARDVFSQRYGDCKDKATLLKAMLEQIGVQSYYLVINTVRGSVKPGIPAGNYFNHVILAIRLPAEARDPALLATVQHPRLGRLLLFDPTDALTPFGRLRGPLQANYGMLVTPEGGELLESPQMPGESNGIRRTARFTLEENGILKGDVEETWIGDFGSEERGRLRNATRDVDRIKPVESRLAKSLAQFQVVTASVNNKDATELPFEWRYSIEAGNYAKSAGGLLMVRPRVLGVKSSDLLEDEDPRQHPVELEAPLKDSDTFEITIPPQYQVDELPPPTTLEYPFGSYRSRTEAVGRALRYTRTLEIRQVNIPLQDADKLRAFYREILTDERRVAVLKRAGP